MKEIVTRTMSTNLVNPSFFLRMENVFEGSSCHGRRRAKYCYVSYEGIENMFLFHCVVSD